MNNLFHVNTGFCALSALYFITSDICLTRCQLRKTMKKSGWSKKKLCYKFGHINSALEFNRVPYRLREEKKLYGSMQSIIEQNDVAVLFHVVLTERKGRKVHNVCAYCPFRSKFVYFTIS